MKVKTQTNPKGMETFLTSSPGQSQEKTEVQQTNPKPQPQSKVEDEIESILQELEKKMNVKTLDFSTFNKVMFNKKLVFRLLYIRNRIYLKVRDEKGEKSVVIAVEIPRWGGSSLRYLITSCSESECVVIERNTSKGKILTYSPIASGKSSPEISDIDDIFD